MSSSTAQQVGQLYSPGWSWDSMYSCVVAKLFSYPYDVGHPELRTLMGRPQHMRLQATCKSNFKVFGLFRLKDRGAVLVMHEVLCW
jgi:hypothetical protein